MRKGAFCSVYRKPKPCAAVAAMCAGEKKYKNTKKKKTQQALCLFCRNETRCKWRGVQRASVVMPSSSGGFLCAAAYMFATIFTCPVDHRRDDCRKKAIFLTSDSTFKAQTCDFCITIDSWTSWAGDWMVRRKKETWRHVFLLCCSKKQQKKTKLSDNILNWHIFDVVHCAVFFFVFFQIVTTPSGDRYLTLQQQMYKPDSEQVSNCSRIKGSDVI